MVYYINEAKLSKEKLEATKKWHLELANRTGETRIFRIEENPQDHSSWQTFQLEDNPRPGNEIYNLIDENTYLIGDLHFSKFDSKARDMEVVRMLNKIPRNGVLLILGDVGHLGHRCQEYVKEIFRKINCENIYLVLGNHDEYPLDYYYDDLGIKGIYDRIYLSERKWIFSHQPCNGPKKGLINFHGHIHEDNLETGKKQYSSTIKEPWTRINCWEGYCEDEPKTIRDWLEWKQRVGIEK